MATEDESRYSTGRQTLLQGNSPALLLDLAAIYKLATMKEIIPFLLLVCAGFLCVRTTASSSDSHPEPAQLQPHKRQADQGQVCNDVIVSQQCVSGHTEAYAQLVYQCGGSGWSLARTLESSCRANAMGQFCGVIDVYSLTNSAQSACSTTPCSSECRDLLISAKEQLGCCLNIYNDTTSGLYDSMASALLSYSLWSGCGVEPSTEQCAPTTVNIVRQSDPTCTQAILLSQLYSQVLCNTRYIDSNFAALEGVELCRTYTDYSPNDSCRFNEFGQYCEGGIDLQDNLDRASESCPNTDTCEPGCVDTLREVTGRLGCCINYYNQSGGGGDHLSYEFWSRCGLVSPGFCEVRLTTPDSAGATTTAPATDTTITRGQSTRGGATYTTAGGRTSTSTGSDGNLVFTAIKPATKPATDGSMAVTPAITTVFLLSAALTVLLLF